MKLIDKTVKVPAWSLSTERDVEGNLTNAVRAEFGRAAVDVGTPDRGLNDDCTDAADAIANVLHWIHGLGADPRDALRSAARHFDSEVETVEKRAVRILLEAGIEAELHHTGGGIWVAEALSASIPDRVVWISDSEGEEGGRYLVGTYSERYAEDTIKELSGACSEKELVELVRRALTRPGDALEEAEGDDHGDS